MASVVASHVHTVRTYGADVIVLVLKKLWILPHTFNESFFSKQIHGRQKKQHKISLKNMLSFDLASFGIISLIQLYNSYFPPLSSNHFDMTNNKVRRLNCELFFKIGKPVVALPRNGSPSFSYLIYLSLIPSNVQFLLRQIDAIDRDTVQPVAKNVSAPFFMECVPQSSTLMPRHSN